MKTSMNREALIRRIAELEGALKACRKKKGGVDAANVFGLSDLEHADDGICMCHAIEGFPYVRFTFWNRRMVDLTGYDRETINRKGWYQSIYPDPEVQARAMARMNQLREGVNLEAETWEITRADGEHRTVRITTCLMNHEQSNPMVMAIMYDITWIKHAQVALDKERQALKRKLARADQALKASDARYLDLFDKAGDAIMIHDANGTIVDVNQMALDLLGYPRTELFSLKIPELHPPEAFEQSRWAFEAIARDGHVTFEIDFIGKNGDIIPTEVSSSIVQVDGRPAIQAIVRDIRERKLAELDRRETLAIIESSSVTVFLWRNEAHWPVAFVTANVERIFGYTDSDFLSGKVRYSQVLHPDDRERVTHEVATFSQEADRTEFRHVPYRIVTKDGATRWVSDQTLIRRDHAGRITHYQGIVEDISSRIEAEQALKESEEKFSKAFHSSPDAIILSRLKDGRILEVNEGFTRTSGYERDEVVGRNTGVLNLWADPSDRNHYVQMIAETGRIRDVAYRFRIKSGEIRDGLLSAEVIQIGTQRCLLGTIRDITADKQIKHALRESEARFRQIADNIKEVFWLFDWQEQRVLYVSPAYELTWGRSREALYACYDEWGESIHPDDVPHAQRTFNRILETGGGEPREYRIVRPDGSQRWISDTGYAIKDEDGAIVRVAGLAEDITERKRTEEALSREKERLAVTLRSIGDAVISTDREGRIALMNPVAEDLTGRTEAESLNRPLMEVFRIINEQTRQPCTNPVEKVLSTGQIVGLANHTLLVAKDGREYIIADSGAPIRDREGIIIGVVLVFRDITAQQRTEEELLKMEKLKSLGVLAGGIAHDFNNFLTGIIGNLSLAKLDVQPGNPVSRALSEMEKAAVRAKDLTQQLLTFSKGGEPVKRITRIADLVQESAQFALHGSNVRCRFELDGDLLPADVDEGQIAQVVHNLILNADQAMPDGGTVRIRGTNVTLASKNAYALVPGRYLAVSIRDEGKGIHPEYLKKIFDPYFTTKQKGSGLGLAVAYSIVAKHDGQLTVESQLGQGTTFTLMLPAVEENQMAQSHPDRQLVKGHGRVLVMDDEDFIRDLATAMLEKMGYQVAVAPDGQAAVSIYQEALETDKPFDAVILDLTVPGGMGGKEAVQKLASLDPTVKAIVSSGYSNDPVMADHARHGFCGAVNKPYLIEEMAQVLDTVIKG
jgi:PAS domain S-box-containing protein